MQAKLYLAKFLGAGTFLPQDRELGIDDGVRYNVQVAGCHDCCACQECDWW